MKQLDRNVTLCEESGEDEKYISIKHYLKAGWFGSDYHTFAIAIEQIEEIEMNEDLKHEEKE